MILVRDELMDEIRRIDKICSQHPPFSVVGWFRKWNRVGFVYEHWNDYYEAPRVTLYQWGQKPRTWLKYPPHGWYQEGRFGNYWVSGIKAGDEHPIEERIVYRVPVNDPLVLMKKMKPVPYALVRKYGSKKFRRIKLN